MCPSGRPFRRAPPAGLSPGSVTLDVCRRVIDRTVLVSEDEIRDAMRLVLRTEHWLIEGAAGCRSGGISEGRARNKGLKCRDRPVRPEHSRRKRLTSFLTIEPNQQPSRTYISAREHAMKLLMAAVLLVAPAFADCCSYERVRAEVRSGPLRSATRPGRSEARGAALPGRNEASGQTRGCGSIARDAAGAGGWKPAARCAMRTETATASAAGSFRRSRSAGINPAAERPADARRRGFEACDRIRPLMLWQAFHTVRGHVSARGLNRQPNNVRRTVSWRLASTRLHHVAASRLLRRCGRTARSVRRVGAHTWRTALYRGRASLREGQSHDALQFRLPGIAARRE